MTITLSLELTPQTLKILEQLCNEPHTIVHEQPKPVENLSKPLENLTKSSDGMPAAPVEAPAEKTYTKTDVKAVCLQFSKAGRQDELRAAFAKFGAKKLTEIAESDYPALMEVLGNA